MLPAAPRPGKVGMSEGHRTAASPPVLLACYSYSVKAKRQAAKVYSYDIDNHILIGAPRQVLIRRHPRS